MNTAEQKTMPEENNIDEQGNVLYPDGCPELGIDGHVSKYELQNLDKRLRSALDEERLSLTESHFLRTSPWRERQGSIRKY